MEDPSWGTKPGKVALDKDITPEVWPTGCRHLPATTLTLIFASEFQSQGATGATSCHHNPKYQKNSRCHDSTKFSTAPGTLAVPEGP